MAGKPFFLRVAHAVVEGQYAPEVRHMLLTLAYLANAKTGSAWYSQASIAKAMGITERAVRRREAALEAAGGPIRIVRHRVGPRPSDWRLELTEDRTYTSAQDRTAASGQTNKRPDVEGKKTGRTGSNDRTPASADLRRIDVDDRRSTPAPVPDADGFVLSPPTKQAARRTRKATSDAAPTTVTTGLKEHYLAEYERIRGVAPVFQKWSRAMKAFREMGDLVGLEEGKAIYTRALTDEFTKRIQPWEILDDAGKHRGTRPTRRNGAPQPKQPNVPGTFRAEDHVT